MHNNFYNHINKYFDLIENKKILILNGKIVNQQETTLLIIYISLYMVKSNLVIMTTVKKTPKLVKQLILVN